MLVTQLPNLASRHPQSGRRLSAGLGYKVTGDTASDTVRPLFSRCFISFVTRHSIVFKCFRLLNNRKISNQKNREVNLSCE